MLAHSAAHRASVPIVLDFLAPCVFARGKTTHVTRRPPKLEHISGSSKEPVVPAVPSASSNSDTVTPMQLLNRLDGQLQRFHHHFRLDLPDHTVNIFNRAISDIRNAAEVADIATAQATWQDLKKHEVLRYLGPPQLNMFSRFVAAFCQAKSVESPFTESEIELLQEVATVTAAGGAVDGLREYMLSYIRRNDPAVVIRLYERYQELLGEKIAWRETEEEEEETEDGEDRSEIIPASKTATFNLVRGNILLCVITAHAMQDSFRRALQTALQTTAHFSPNTLRTFLQSLNHDRQLQEKLTAYADRISVARLVARPGSLSRQLSNLTRDTAVPTLARLYRNIIEGLTSPEPWLTVQASQDEVKDTVVVPEFVWASFISGFVQGRRLDLAEKLWDDANNLGLMPTVAMWTALINGYAELKMVQQAINAWDAMLASGLRPDTFTYRALIYALYHSGSGHDTEALRRFQAFKQDLQTMSPRPEDSSVLVVYNTMLHGLLFYHHETEACALLEEMKANGPKPDIVSFNNFLRYYGRKGQLKALADILHTIESEGLVGDVFTFSIVLSALLKVRDDAPQIMFKLMEKQGVKPNAATLTSIIDHQMKAQTEEGFRTALELLTKMEQNELAGAQPNAVTYTSILSHIHRRNWLDRKIALEYQEFLWNRMRFRGLKPNRVTYNILIKACLENPEPEGIQDAIRYYRDMVEKRIFVATDTWYILLHALVDRKEWALANELVGDMQRSGFVPPKALSNLVTKVRRQTREKMKAGPAGYI